MGLTFNLYENNNQLVSVITVFITLLLANGEENFDPDKNAIRSLVLSLVTVVPARS